MSKVFQVAFEIAGKMGASFQSTFSSASAQMHTLGAQSAALRSNLKTLDVAYSSGVINVDSYKNAQARLKAQLEQTRSAQSGLMAAQSQQNEASKRSSQIRGRMVDTAITAAPLMAATKAAIDFETAMGGVAKQVQGARDDNGELTPTYYQMQSNVMNLSRDLRMMPSVVADTTAAAARMGVQGADALNDFVKMSVQMGVAFEGSGDVIAEQMAKIANIRGIKIDTAEGRAQIKDLADTVNYLDDQTTAKGPEIIEVLQRISGTAAQSTFSNNELAALGTTMLDLGKTPETAATGLNALMNRLATAPSQAKPFQETLVQLGIDARELQASYMMDSKGTLFSLLDQIKGLDKAQQAETLTGLFGAEYQDDISALASGMDKLRGNMDLLNDSARQGSMEKEFAAKLKLTASSIDAVKQSTAETGISLGQVFLPAIVQISGAFQAGAQHLAAFRQEHPQLTNAIVITTAGLVGFRLAWLATSFSINQYKDTVAGVKLLLASQNAQMVINKTSMLMSAGASKAAAAGQWLFNASLYGCPVVWIVAGLAAIVAAGYLLYQNFDKVKAFCETMWDNPTAKILFFVTGPIGLLVGAGVGIIANWETVKAWFVTLWNDPSAAVGQFTSYVQSKFSNAYNAGAQFAGNLSSSISSGINSAINYVAALPGRITVAVTETAQAVAFGVGYMIGYIANLPGRVTVFAVNTGTALVAGIQNGINTTSEYIASGVTNMVGYISALPGEVYIFAVATGTAMTTAIGNGVNSTIQIFTELPANAAAALDGFLQTVDAWGSNIYTSVVNWVGQIPNAISSAISSAGSFVSNLIGGASGSFSAGMQAGGGSVDIASNAVGGIYGQGAFLTTFAEKSKEAAIPIDGSARSISLWQQTGDLLGINTSSQDNSPSIWQKAGDMLGAGGGGDTYKITFAPVINGANREEIMPELQRQQDSFMDRLKDVVHQQGRVSYGS
ncbi:hypothetical protein SPSIL_009080 [Sporomusa silvacetica DSM 10669]|uniref:Phage tail tape measure protein domain-containing protein n=1 Tax=Sporomusa silvacetica DSM 10669 TaxID=1123289 RepID=A0ABZ3IHA0_9FIRM|nr:phage tail tape measure protein [Sporomusa silvacetica]OZC13132.1 phage-related minor tail protein [Sporomusa silvacetica DSM 10669]